MLTAERLREVISYDPLTGDFTWRILPASKVARLGKPAGYLPSGNYRQIQIDGRLYTGHRLAWLYMTGDWPKNQIDHRDCDRTNDRWDNLREATRSQNHGNKRGRRGHLKGTDRRESGKWRAQIRVDGKNFYLGNFETEQQAHKAYMAKARELFGEFARAA